VAWIELDGAVNVRDLGGLPTEDGGKTADARLLRADNLQELSPSDIAVLVGEVGVTTVVDLRSSSELASEGPAPLDGVAGVRHTHHPVLPEAYAADMGSEPDESHRPRPRTMAAFLQQVGSRYGGAVPWLAGHGFGPDDLLLLRAKLLRP
jgi:protein-tyrosine phosphatase